MAHQLARIFYHLVSTQQEYDESVFAKQDERARQQTRKRLERQAAQMGLRLVAAK